MSPTDHSEDDKGGTPTEVCCNACGFEASFIPEGMIQCERCRAVFYCSVDCLRWDWKSGGHAKVCVSFVVEEEGSNSSSSSMCMSEDRSLNNTEFSESSLSFSIGGGDGNHDSGGNSGGPSASLLNSNTERLRQWGEKIKHSSTSSVPSTSSTSLNDSDSTNDENRGGMKLNTFLHNQKKQAKRVATPSPPPRPVPIEEDKDEEIEEVIEEEELDRSIDIMNASSVENLNSIVEESESPGDEPDIEGSWRSRDPFYLPRSSHSSRKPADDQMEVDFMQENVNEISEPLVKAAEEDFSEASIVEESYESVEESGSSYEVMSCEDDGDVAHAIGNLGATYCQSKQDPEHETSEGSSHSEGSSPGGLPAATVKGSVSSTANVRSTRRYSPVPTLAVIDESAVSNVTSLRTSRIFDGLHGDDMDDSSGSSSYGAGVADQLMNQYGYDSEDDGDSCSGSGSLDAENGEETTRTEDTAQLAAQPQYEPDPSKGNRIFEDTSVAEEDSPLYETVPQTAAGQLSKEPVTTGTSTGEQSNEKPSSRTKSIASFFDKQNNAQGGSLPVVLNNGDSALHPGATAPQCSGAASAPPVKHHGSPPSRRSADATDRKSSAALSSLLEFPSVFSSAATNDTSNNAHASKVFRQVYQSPTATTEALEPSVPATADPTTCVPTSAEPSGDCYSSTSSLPDLCGVSNNVAATDRSAVASGDSSACASSLLASAPSLLDFRNVYSSSTTTGTAANDAPAFKDFQQAHQSQLTTPTLTTNVEANRPSIAAEAEPATSVQASAEASGPFSIPDEANPSVEAPLQNGPFSFDKAVLFGEGAAETVMSPLTREVVSQKQLDDPQIGAPMKFYGALIGANAYPQTISAEPIVVAIAQLQENGDDGFNSASSRESNPNSPPTTTITNMLSADASSQTATSSGTSDAQSSNATLLPRYLEYRNNAAQESAEADATTETDNGRVQNGSVASAATVPNALPSMEPHQEKRSRVLSKAEAARNDLRRLQEDAVASRQQESHEQANEGKSEIAGGDSGGDDVQVEAHSGSSNQVESAPLLPNDAAASFGAVEGSQGDSSSSAPRNPRYLAYRSYLAQSSDRTLGVSPAPLNQHPAAPDLQIEAPQAENSFDRSSTVLPVPSGTQVGAQPALSNSLSRYHSYRSHLARGSGSTVLSTEANEENGTKSIAAAAAVTSGAVAATDENDIGPPSTGVEGSSALVVPGTDENSDKLEAVASGRICDSESNVAAATVTPENERQHPIGSSYSIGGMSCSSLSVVSESSSRYLSYRESIARRIHCSASKSTESDDDVDDADVEERLSSYLHKSKAGATVATAALAAQSSAEFTHDELANDSNPPSPASPDVNSTSSTSLSRAEAAPGERFSLEPLRSRRAADALAEAHESQLEFEKSRTDSSTFIGDVDEALPRSSSDQPVTSNLPVEPATEVAADVPLDPETPSTTIDLEAGMANQGSEPAPLQVENPTTKDSASRTQPQLKYGILVIIFFLVVLLAVGLGISLSNRNNDAADAASAPIASNVTTSPTPFPNTEDTPPVPSNAPSPQEIAMTPTLTDSTDSPTETNSPSVNPQAEELLDLLSGVAFDGGDSIQEDGTPQNQAYTWLLQSSVLDLLPDERKIQRYALATLYYSCGGENWTSSDGWLSEDDECEWFSRSSSVCENMGSVTDLSLGFNNLRGPLPPEIALLSKLSTVALGEGNLTGAVPENFASLSLLTFFSVHGNALEGQLSDVLDGWPLLEFLDVGVNQFTGSFPEELTRQSELRELDLSSNRFEGTLPDVSSLTNLERLSLNDNNFSGSLDGSISQLSNLRYLTVYRNSLTALPNALGLMTALEVFEAYENSISGALFRGVSGLTELRVLDLHMNDLSGQIPQDIGLLESLRYLDLSTNNFEGEIPTEMGLLVNLIDLLLYSNELSGELPTELVALRRLGTFRIDDNNLVGAVPTEVCDLFSETLPTFYLDCGGSTPEMSCPPGACCTYCCEDGGETDASSCRCVFEGTRLEFLC